MPENTQRAGLRPAQEEVLKTLGANFGLSESELNRCLFFLNGDDQPWIPPDILEAIARQTGGFKTISSTYGQFIPQLNQVVWDGLVVDAQDRSFPRSGVATIGERPSGIEIDTHVLAKGRALSSSLQAAGFDPFRAGSVIARSNVAPRDPDLQRITDEAALRTKDMRQIHKIATDKGLIRNGDMYEYREWLRENFGVISSGVLDAKARVRVVNALTLYQPGTWTSQMQNILNSAGEEALIA
jgi:hypothetical protein